MRSEQVTGMARLHALIFSLLYPGFLAAFMLAQFTEESRVKGFQPWGWILCVYFALQFVEGHEHKTEYRAPRAAVNLLEIATMSLIFGGLGYFPGLKATALSPAPGLVATLMALVFALPALHRIVFAADSLRAGRSGYWFARSLTGMSLVAATLAGVFPAATWSWLTVLALLVSYMLFFQFANAWILDRLDPHGRARISSFRRP